MEESVTYEEFKKHGGRVIGLVAMVFIFTIYKIIVDGFTQEYIIILIASPISLIGIRQLILIAEQRLKNEERKIKYWEDTTLSYTITFILGIGGIYLFFVKGAYGLYLVFKIFSFWSLLYRIAIIILTYHLVASTSKLITVINALKK